jgi:hypothetical protein
VRLTLLIVYLAVAACSLVSEPSAYVELAPIDELLAQADVTAVDPGPALAARAARLRARAAALQP